MEGKFSHGRESKIGSSYNRGFEISDVAYSVRLKQIKSKGNDNWFELSGGSRNQGFEKSGLMLLYIFIQNEHVVLYTDRRGSEFV